MKMNAMKTAKLERLQAAGWKVGNAQDFLQLSNEAAQLVASRFEKPDINLKESPDKGGINARFITRGYVRA